MGSLLLAALLTLKVDPKACFPPCSIRIVAHVERHPLNRWLVIQMDGDDMFQSTAIQLDGDQAPETQRQIWFKSVPAGNYTVLGVLFRQQEKSEVARVAVPVHVIAEESDTLPVAGGVQVPKLLAAHTLNDLWPVKFFHGTVSPVLFGAGYVTEKPRVTEASMLLRLRRLLFHGINAPVISM